MGRFSNAVKGKVRAYIDNQKVQMQRQQRLKDEAKQARQAGYETGFLEGARREGRAAGRAAAKKGSQGGWRGGLESWSAGFGASMGSDIETPKFDLGGLGMPRANRKGRKKKDGIDELLL